MKKVIQILLFLITIIIIIIFYQKYFISEQNTEIKESVNQTQSQSESSKNNLIKNLRYDLNLQDNTKYMIIANESEIFYDKDAEMVNMTNVKAKFIDANNDELVIRADKAIFNSATYNTDFNQNVIITYQDNTILSENLDLNFIN
ncbi:LPS export ABC transporter periplasmic protein LptC, partial [Pelagibacterales bacterium SAG-MED19]|nr:LPS export ABC transporter periplasmic protein LptC [Pelagibacterales bacterium SAG-MED19]